MLLGEMDTKYLKPSRVPALSPRLPSGEGTVTFVVHVGRQLHTAHGDIHPQVAEVGIRLEKKLGSQLHVVPFLILLVDQYRVVVVKLGRDRSRPGDRAQK